MKKGNTVIIISILIVFLLVTYITFPHRRDSVLFDDFDEYQDDFETVAEFLQDYYASLDTEEIIVVWIYDSQITHDKKCISPRELEKPIKTVKSKGLHLAHVGKDYVYFYCGETTNAILLWAKRPKKVIKEMNHTLPARRLTRHWYDLSYRGI